MVADILMYTQGNFRKPFFFDNYAGQLSRLSVYSCFRYKFSCLFVFSSLLHEPVTCKILIKMNKDLFIDVGSQLAHLRMYPVFDTCHYLLTALQVRDDIVLHQSGMLKNNLFAFPNEPKALCPSLV